MGLAVDYQRVKVKCGITGSEYDSAINALISEHVPVLEFAINPTFLADTGNAGLVATMNLSATEIVCGEFVAERLRVPGASDTLKIGEVTLNPLKMEDSMVLNLISVGWERLRPFLKKDVGVLGTVVAGAGGKYGGDE